MEEKVDNFASRRLFHRVFRKSRSFAYIDSGNGMDYSQVGVRLRHNGNLILPPIRMSLSDILNGKKDSQRGDRRAHRK